MAFRRLGDWFARYVGIGGATGDASNPLSVRGSGSLFDGHTGGHQIRINKAATGDTASFLFQTGFSGRAEFGTVGSDSFGLKVSTDGSAFTDVFTVNGTGTATFQHDTLFAGGVGIGGASPDGTNRLSVNTQAALFNNAGSDIRLTMNKAAVGDDAALTYQDGFSTRALLGLLGNDDWTLKVSPNGSTFYDAFVVDKDSGAVDFPAGVTGVAADEFGLGAVINTDYMASKGTDLITNGTGLLGNNYNMPSIYEWDAVVAPNLPAAFKYGGYFPGLAETTEFLPVNPNQVYRLRSALRQDTYRHLQYMGLVLYDSDFNLIVSENHMRYRGGGNDSYTTLTAPLTPGDTTISVADASGWNNTQALWHISGVIIFEYKNSAGFKYDYYSRIAWTSYGQSMWSPGGINTSTGVITLDSAFPSYLANPDDPNGTWPVGTRIANRNSGGTYKYSFYAGLRVPTTGLWYATENFMGGVDKSGTNTSYNFSPGTAYAKVFWLPNYSNRSGGWNVYPDSGTTAPVWFAGISVTPEPMAKLIANTTGIKTIKVPRINATGTSMEAITAPFTVEEIV